jgi:hypothetical protein
LTPGTGNANVDRVEGPGDLVQAALDERRDRQAQQRVIAHAETLTGRCRDAAERSLWVRVFLLGGTTLAGGAVAVTDRLLTLDPTNRDGSGACTHIELAALVRVTVADPGRWQRTAPDPGPDASAMIHVLADLARRGSDVEVTTSDGFIIGGVLISLGDRALGLVTGPCQADIREGDGTFDQQVDWVDPAHIVAVAEVR